MGLQIKQASLELQHRWGWMCLQISQGLDHLTVMFLMTSLCVFNPAGVKRPRRSTSPTCRATRLVVPLIRSSAVSKPRQGRNPGEILCTALRVPAETQPVSLILSWLVRDYRRVGLCWGGKIETDKMRGGNTTLNRSVFHIQAMSPGKGTLIGSCRKDALIHVMYYKHKA